MVTVRVESLFCIRTVFTMISVPSHCWRAPCMSNCVVAANSSLFGAKISWLMLLPKVGRLTRSPIEVNKTCSIS